MKSYILSKFLYDQVDKSEGRCLDINQMTDGNHYDISDPKDYIAYCIFNNIENYIDSRYTSAFIKKLLGRDGTYELLLSGNADGVDKVVIKVDNKHKSYYYDLHGETNLRQLFEIQEISDSNLVYLVTEHLLSPFPDCDLIERCYHRYFDDLLLAQQYCGSHMRLYSCKHGYSGSGYRIFVADRTKLDKSEWYLKNIKAADNISKYKLKVEDYRYIPDIDLVNDTVLADAYDDLPEEEKWAVDQKIYNIMSEFFTEDELDYDYDYNGDDLKGTVDTMIATALARASSEKEFMRIHEALGPYEYRIDSLTDEIYFAHQALGYILLTTDGELQWYEPPFFIMNEWEGAHDKENIWFGKFQANTSDPLLAFREYHPELIVKRFPTDDEIKKYKDMYWHAKGIERRQHNEIGFFLNGNGEETVKGHWYPDGPEKETCFKFITFVRKYMKYRFNEEQCKMLLSGEELVIDDYISKTGDKVRIRGCLQNVSAFADEGDVCVSFVRTDIGSSVRLSINRELGIEEKGLFQSSEGI